MKTASENQPADLREAITCVILLAACRIALEKLKEPEEARHMEAALILEEAIQEAEKK